MIGGVATDATLWDKTVATLGDVADCLPLVAEGDSIDRMASRLLADVEGRFALIGHSMGGYVALAVQRIAPERVERLALINSGANAEGDAQQCARQALMALVRERGFTAMLERLVPAMVGPDTRRDAAMMTQLGAMVERTGAERFLREQNAVMHRPEARSMLGGVAVPTLIMSGADDRIVAPNFGADTARAIPGAAFRQLARCGHIAPVERADAMSGLLRAWLSDAPLPADDTFNRAAPAR